MAKKFNVGERYYSFGSDETGPLIQTWTYCGFQKVEDCTSTSCDVPYHFHVFELVGTAEREKFRVRFPSIEAANLTNLTWEELGHAIAVADELDRRLADDKAHPEPGIPWEEVKASRLRRD